MKSELSTPFGFSEIQRSFKQFREYLAEKHLMLKAPAFKISNYSTKSQINHKPQYSIFKTKNINHESTKGRKHEKDTIQTSCFQNFVFS